MGRRVLIFATAGLGAALFAGLLIAGCGGGSSGTPPAGVQLNAVFRSLMPAGQQEATLVGSETCGGCHSTKAGEPGNYTTWKDTVHAAMGVGCESCHGPGSAHVAGGGDKTKIIATPTVASAAVCGQCHTGHASPTLKQWDDWSESPHREAVETVIEEGKANPNTYVRTCYRCHNAAFKAVMVEGGANIDTLPTEELQKWADEAVEEVEKTPSDPKQLVSSTNCASCHDPHAKTGNARTPAGKDIQLRRSLTVDPSNATELAKIKPIAPGVTAQTPTVYTSINHVCAQCHNGRGTDASDAQLQKSTARPGMHDSPQFNMLVGMSGWEDPANPPFKRNTAHATAPKQCVTCHMPTGEGKHSFIVKLEGCAPCHSVTDAAARRTSVRNDVEQKLASLYERLNRWKPVGADGKIPWQYSSSGGPTTQSTIPIEIKRARNNYFFVARDLSLGVHNSAYARYLIEMANKQLDALGVTRASRAVNGPELQQFRKVLKYRSPAEYQEF